MNTGLTLEQWHAVSEGWRPDDRAFALELMAWTWKNDALLPDNLRTLQRIARADDTRAFKAAWSRLSTSGVFLLVLGASHWHVPLQDAARAVKKARSRAGKASVAARRQTVTGDTRIIHPKPGELDRMLAAAHAAADVRTGPATKAESASVGRPVSVAAAGEFEEESRPLSNIYRATVRTSHDLDTVALAVASLIVGDGQVRTFDEFRDFATGLIAGYYTNDAPPKVNQTDLTYRVWDEQFLGSYRDRFAVTKTTIAAAPISRSTTPLL